MPKKKKKTLLNAENAECIYAVGPNIAVTWPASPEVVVYYGWIYSAVDMQDRKDRAWDGSRTSAKNKPSPHHSQDGHENRRRGKTARREELDAEVAMRAV